MSRYVKSRSEVQNQRGGEGGESRKLICLFCLPSLPFMPFFINHFTPSNNNRFISYSYTYPSLSSFCFLTTDLVLNFFFFYSSLFQSIIPDTPTLLHILRRLTALQASYGNGDATTTPCPRFTPHRAAAVSCYSRTSSSS